MSENRHKYDEEFKKNAVKLSYASSKAVKEIVDDLCSVKLNETKDKRLGKG